MDNGASAIDHPDPAIVDFVARSGLIPRDESPHFERLPGGVSSDIWLVHAGRTGFCVKLAYEFTVYKRAGATAPTSEPNKNLSASGT